MFDWSNTARTVSFISKGYGGRCSDKFIVEDAGFLNNLKQGDLVMADRGFTVHNAVTLRNVNLAVPSFLGKQTQLSNVEVEYSRGLARIRIHVERIIGATKQRFTVLEGPLHRETLSVLKGEDSAIIDKIVMVCGALYNSRSSGACGKMQNSRKCTYSSKKLKIILSF